MRRWVLTGSMETRCDGLGSMEPDSFQVHVDIDVAEPGEFRELALWWLDSVHAAFVDRPGFEVEEARRPNSGWSYGQDDGPSLTGGYDPQARERFAEALETGPGDASFDVYGTQQAGGPVVWVKLRCWTPVGESTKAEVWVQLALLNTAAATDVDQVEAALVRLLAEFLDSWRPLFAGISDDFDRHSVSLDRAQNLNSRAARLDSSRYLRGYCWVTYCPDLFQASLPDQGHMTRASSYTGRASRAECYCRPPVTCATSRATGSAQSATAWPRHSGRGRPTNRGSPDHGRASDISASPGTTAATAPSPRDRPRRKSRSSSSQSGHNADPDSKPCAGAERPRPATWGAAGLATFENYTPFSLPHIGMTARTAADAVVQR